jgi:iron complex transport system ATP-binding protein
MEVARNLAANGALVVAVLHDLNLAASYADRIVIMRDGQIVADGPPKQTLTAGLLSDVFACPIVVSTHPYRDCPLVIPLSAGSDAGHTPTPS